MSAETKLLLTRISRPLLAWYFALLYGGGYAGLWETDEHQDKLLGTVVLMVALVFFGEGAAARFGLGDALAERIKPQPQQPEVKK